MTLEAADRVSRSVEYGIKFGIKYHVQVVIIDTMIIVGGMG